MILDARYTFLYDIRAEISVKKSQMAAKLDWISLENVSQSLPKTTTMNEWVKELAMYQVVVFQKILSSGIPENAFKRCSALPVRWWTPGG